MLNRILIAIVVLLAAPFGLSYVIPAEQTVARSVAVKPAPEVLYAQVASLRKWQAWAPWSARNFPAEQFSFDGPEAGVGARMLWQGLNGRGGSLWLTQADPQSGVAFEMSMGAEPQKASGTIQLVPGGAETLVVWTWRVRFKTPLERWEGLLVDEMIGPQFDAALVQLKKVVEAEAPLEPPAQAPSTPEETPPTPDEAAARPPEPPEVATEVGSDPSDEDPRDATSASSETGPGDSHQQSATPTPE
jgi:hypothetical protein